MALPKLSYFNGRGRCEHIRYLYAAGGVEYEDYRLKDGEWNTLKPETPFGGLPILDVGGARLGQSIAIGRFVAKQTKLYGSTPVEEAIIDGIVDTTTELRESVAMKVAFEKDPVKKEQNTKEVLSSAKIMFDNLVKIYTKNNTTYLVGSKLSWADIHFMAVIELAITLGGMTTVLDDHPILKDLYDRVRQNEGIKKYIDRRPKNTPF